MRLAVLGDAVGEAAKAPGFGLDHRSAVIGDDLGRVFRERIDLGLGQVLTREENMLVKRHVILFCWPIADAAPCERPSGCRRMKRAARTEVRRPSCAGHCRKARRNGKCCAHGDHAPQHRSRHRPARRDEPARLALSRPGVPRGREARLPARGAAGGVPCQRHRRAGRVAQPRLSRRERDRHSRRRRRGARVRQRLPPSRVAAGRWQRRAAPRC